jgi:hypothetical protein
MMNGNGQGQRGKEPVERVLDLFVHTPIGLAVMAWKRVPELVTSVPDFVGQAMAKGCATVAGVEERVTEEVRKARMIGQVAVTFGTRQLRKEVDHRLGRNGKSPVSATTTPTTPASSPKPAAKPAAAKKAATKAPAKRAPAKKAAARTASAADLPIREYDGLSASQVVSRLTGLTPEELRAVRSYEEDSRGRRTVILAIDRLL